MTNQGPSRSNQHRDVQFKMSQSLIDDLDEVAFEASTPKNRVTRSDVLREAARDYVEQYREDPSVLDPATRGSLGEDAES